jgi:hypothetical protein
MKSLSVKTGLRVARSAGISTTVTRSNPYPVEALCSLYRAATWKDPDPTAHPKSETHRINAEPWVNNMGFSSCTVCVLNQGAKSFEKALSATLD